MSVRIVRPLLRGPRSAVTAAHPLAVAAGSDVLAAGGNALDAAIAAAAALAVLTPDACGLGGDALLLVQARGEPPVAFLGAATVPRRPILPITVYGPASAGVPGAVAAWCAAHARFGRLPLAGVFTPSVELAAEGFPVSAGLTDALARRRERLQAGAAGWSVLGASTGATLRQPELAGTLRAICAEGAAGFYTGAVAAATTAAVRGPEGEGIGAEDLAGYAVAEEAPLTGAYGRAGIAVVPAPSQAALAVLALEAVEHAPPPGSADGEHAAIEAIKEAFELREALTGGAELEALRRTPIPVAGARASARREPTAGDHTAAVASADADGTVVSMLVSVFHEFGSGVLVPDAGFILNNRLSSLAGSVSGPADLPRGGRAPHTLSPMLLDLDARRLALATPGADGQVQTLVQIVRRLVDTNAGLSAALHAPRWRAVAGRLAIETSFDAEVLDALAARGHAVDLLPDGDPLFGGAAAAGTDGVSGVLCASDPRREVWAAVR
jgi:gamma-glutamyltranspeptidase / glutathione hydrolase